MSMKHAPNGLAKMFLVIILDPPGYLLLRELLSNVFPWVTDLQAATRYWICKFQKTYKRRVRYTVYCVTFMSGALFVLLWYTVRQKTFIVVHK